MHLLALVRVHLHGPELAGVEIVELLDEHLMQQVRVGSHQHRRGSLEVAVYSTDKILLLIVICCQRSILLATTERVNFNPTKSEWADYAVQA